MSASFTRSSLGRGPAIATLGSTVFYARSDMMTRHAPVYDKVSASLFGRVDDAKKNNVIKHTILVFGLYQDLSVLFPSYITNPTVGASVYGSSDQAFTYLARNGDKLTYHNTQITKLLDLYLGVDSEVFAAAIELTSLLANGANPEDSAAYFTRQTGQTYAEPSFALTNFLKQRFTGAWGSKTGFGTIVPQKGFNIQWAFDTVPMDVDGYGTADLTVGEGGLIGTCKAIPIGPTDAQVDTAQNMTSVMGRLLSADAADLTLTSTLASIVLKAAGITESGTVFGVGPLRKGEVVWKTTRAFSAGTPQAVTTLA